MKGKLVGLLGFLVALYFIGDIIAFFIAEGTEMLRATVNDFCRGAYSFLTALEPSVFQIAPLPVVALFLMIVFLIFAIVHFATSETKPF